MSKNVLEKLNQAKARERELLASAGRIEPTIEDFWCQPQGVRLILIEGDQLDAVAETVTERGSVIVRQRTGKMSAFPAHVGTLLSRRRRGNSSVAVAAWFSNGWTKVQETTGGTVVTDLDQLSSIATRLRRRVVAVFYDYFEESAGLVEVAANGDLARHTYVTAVARTPHNPNHHLKVVSAPNPDGLTLALREAGIDINSHVLCSREMMTIVSTYDV